MMLKQELIHSHILVAILCGWEPQKPNKEFPNGSMFLSTGDTPEDQNEVSNDNILEELPYSTDWNYFLAAWDTLSEEDGEKEFIDILNNIEDAILDVNIELAFKELLRGINYLNQRKLHAEEA